MNYESGDVQSHWEYADFVFAEWKPPHTWVCLATQERYSAPLARQFFWQVFGNQIDTALQEWFGQGWHNDSQIGPEALKMRTNVFAGATIDASDVVLWIATLGFALILQLILGGASRKYVRYEPVEFRVSMRRCVADGIVSG